MSEQDKLVRQLEDMRILNKTLERNIQDLNKQNYQLMKRISELTAQADSLPDPTEYQRQ